MHYNLWRWTSPIVAISEVNNGVSNDWWSLVKAMSSLHEIFSNLGFSFFFLFFYRQNPVWTDQRASTPPRIINHKRKVIRELSSAGTSSIENSSTSSHFGSKFWREVFQCRLELRWFPNIPDLCMVKVKRLEHLSESNCK